MALNIDVEAAPARKSLSREIYETLETAITTGRLVPGTRLGDDEIATAFSVSRSPAREALAELQRIGFAERTPNRDRRVTVPTDTFVSDTFDVWTLLESERLYEASLACPPENLKIIDSLVAQLEHMSTDDEAASHALLARFHAALRVDCHNRQLQRVGDDWSKYIVWFRSLYFGYTVEDARDALDEHRLIVACFKRREREGLFTALRAHMAWQRDRILAGWSASPAVGFLADGGVVDVDIASIVTSQ
jgi:DNA-binding GntR family transcriptional regulator